MGLQIVVFVEDTTSAKHANIINEIEALSPVLVDAKNGSDREKLKSYYNKNARFFYVSEFISMCTPEELELRPDFVVSFNDEEEISERDWVCIERTLENAILKIAVADHVLEVGKKWLCQFVTATPIGLPPVSEPLDHKQHYELFVTEIADRDICLIQVEKPYCDLPYTVVIRNYSQKGRKSFFTDLFICESWGVARKDYEFLEQVWNHWGMEGVYDLDKMLHEATKRCFPQEGEQPEPEPEVYRRPIENVLETFKKREEGVQITENDFWNEMRLKKRKLEDDLLR
jgi:hypothetical protein